MTDNIDNINSVTSIFLNDQNEPDTQMFIEKVLELLQHNSNYFIFSSDSHGDATIEYNTYVKDGCLTIERS